MLIFWAYIGTQIAVICRNSQIQGEVKKNPSLPVIFIMAAMIIGLVINMVSFLEEYDFSGKRIIPFCSHGGGRFGQSLTAIAKIHLLPNTE